MCSGFSAVMKTKKKVPAVASPAQQSAEDDEDGDMDESPGGAIASPLLSPVSALSASPVPSPGGASSAGLPPEELHDADAEAVTRSLA